MADDTRKEQDKPASITYDGAVKKSELPDPTPQWKTESHIQASGYSDAKRQNIEEQWKPIESRAADFVRTKAASRTTENDTVTKSQAQASKLPEEKPGWIAKGWEQAQKLKTTVQTKIAERIAPRGTDAQNQAPSSNQQGVQQTRGSNPAQVARSQTHPAAPEPPADPPPGQQRARGPNVFDRHSPGAKTPEPSKQAEKSQPAQTQARPTLPAQKQKAQEQAQQKQAVQNVFDRQRQQRDTSQKQKQQEKGKERGR